MGYSLEAAVEKGRPLPSWFEEAEPLEAEYGWLVEAFWTLSTCRPFGWSVGPIPVTAVWAFADRRGLTRELADVLEYVVRAMDEAYLTHVQAQSKKTSNKMSREPRGAPDRSGKWPSRRSS